MRQVVKLRSQAPDTAATAPGEGRDFLPAPWAPGKPTESAEHTAGYSADRAAIAFGIPRIAPVLRERRSGGPPEPELAAAAEDVTESLTAAEREAAGAFPALGEAAPESELTDPVTAALRLPSRRSREARAAWGGTPRPPFTDRLVVPASSGLPEPEGAPPLRASRVTAVLPHLGRGPGDAATTTLTLPSGQGSAAALAFAVRPGAGETSYRRLAKWGLWGAAAALTLLIAALVGRALTLSDLWPGAALRPPPLVPRAPPAPGAYRQRLIEQAVVALREGHREQALGFLLRYQTSEPAGSTDPAVEIMLGVLKKDLGIPRH